MRTLQRMSCCLASQREARRHLCGWCFVIIVALVNLASSVSPIISFQLSRNASFLVRRFDKTGEAEVDSVTARHASSLSDDEMTSKTSSTKEVATLKFIGKKTFVSDSMPFPTSYGKSLEDFFSIDEHLKTVLRGLSNVVYPATIEETNSCMTDWERECERLGAAKPEVGDKVMTVKTAGIKFPGLRIDTISHIGSKLVLQSRNGIGSKSSAVYPEYQNVLIRNEQKPVGLKVLVWVFNSLTGKKKEDGGEQSVYSLATVSAAPSDDGTGIFFIMTAQLEVNVKFPSILLKIMPVSKEKAEEQGSASLMNALQRDMEPALDKFMEAYLKWLK